MKLRHILIACLTLLPSMAMAQQYDGLDVIVPTTIDGLQDGTGPAAGGTSGFVTGTAPLTIDGIGGEYSGFITDSVSLIILNADQALSGGNDFSGGTTIGSGGILRVRSDDALGSGPLILESGGTFVVESLAPFITGLDARAGSTIDMSGGHIFLQVGTHTVATSLNGGGGTIFMNSGAILSLQAINALNQVSLNPLGNTLVLMNGFNQQLGDPVSSSTFLSSDEIDLGGGTLSITGTTIMEGSFTGGGTIQLDPAGTLQLGGVNPIQDGIIINIVDNASGSFNLAGSTITFTEDTLLSNSNSSISLSTLSSGPGTVILDVSPGEEIQLGRIGEVGGAGSITKNGTGTLRLGLGDYTGGAFDINAGMVILTSAINGAGGATMTVDSGATLTTPGTATITGVTFTNNGTIDLDAGTQLTVPNYTGAGLLDFGLTDSGGAQLRVASGGTANFLAGSAITATTLAGNYSLGQNYTVVDLLSGATLSGAANIDGNTITTPLVELEVNATNGL
ncbi:MAG: hypothetical protein M3O22_06580, partial [Pseudomonadota bacterium]|nr:hypothetical protein [Pseudomonadota bacterium]